MTKRDKYRYKVRDEEHRIVYIGSSKDPAERAEQHLRGGKDFATVRGPSHPVTSESARNWEREQIEKYKKGHCGKRPKYNKTDWG